jgi:hypothetical protein
LLGNFKTKKGTEIHDLGIIIIVNIIIIIIETNGCNSREFKREMSIVELNALLYSFVTNSMFSHRAVVSNFAVMLTVMGGGVGRGGGYIYSN